MGTRSFLKKALASILLTTLIGVGSIDAKPSSSPDTFVVQHGKASFYSIRCNGGTKTASGRRLKDNEMTAAHKSLPFGTLVRVTNLKNNKSEIVQITDRGPYIKGRIIDVTVEVARKLGFIKQGVIDVRLDVLKK